MKTIIPPYYSTLKEGEEPEDFFKRGAFQQNLTNLLSNTEEPLVLALNARWGEGKTNFIKLWERDLLKDNSDLIPIYYDAFKNDFSDEVFISIAVTIQREIIKYYDHLKRGYAKKREEEIEAYKESAKALGKKLISVAGGTAMKYLTLGILDSSEMIEEAFEKAAKFEKYGSFELTSDKYDSFLSMEETIENYREALKKLLSIETGKSKKIVFFVDELDRCKPLFAVEVIEKIKHLFAIEGVHFVLAINKDQLLSAIKNAYGVEEHAGVYLQKFVHLEALLPSVQNLGYNTDDLIPYLSYLKNEFEIPDDVLEIGKLNFLIKRLNRRENIVFVPRSIERLLTLYATVLKSTGEEFKKENWRKILFLCLLKNEAPDIYQQAKEHKQFRSLFWGHRVPGATNLGSLPQHISGGYFEPNEYQRMSGSSNNDFSLIGFEEVFDVVDIYNIPSIPESYSIGYSEGYSIGDQDSQLEV